MKPVDFYITLTVSLIGIAYPILLQVISRLDEKYDSENIISLFDKEWEGRSFKIALIVTLLLIVVWSLELKPILSIEPLDFIIVNSANILVAISAICLGTIFFFYVRKILIYYTPTKFVPYLIEKHKNSVNDYRHFEALSDILILSIAKHNRNISLTLSEFFYTAFKKERERFSNEPVVYPDIFYSTVYKAIEELAILKEKKNSPLEYRTAGSIWLLGELQGYEVSAKTYSWLWRNLLRSIHYNQDDMVMYHWETAHQYYSYSIPYIYESYNHSSATFEVDNKAAIDKRIGERQKFIEFHYALGGLLINQEKYDCLRRIFSYTNSQPPKYELLPESMTEIFEFYYKVRDPYENRYSWISSTYPFPKQSGIQSDDFVKKWIASYMALLLLRQYTIQPYMIYMRPLDNPRFPQSQTEIKEWINGIDFFKKLLLEHLNNKELLSKLNLDFITTDWCTAHGKIYPTDFIDNLKTELERLYRVNAETMRLSQEKVNLFKNSTTTIINSSLDELMVISNSDEMVDGEFNKWYVNGRCTFQDKDAFVDHPEIHHMDFDTFLATVISNDIKRGVETTFQLKKSKSYILKPQNIFDAIDRLSVDNEFLIIGFNLNIEFYISHLRIRNLTNDSYNGIDLVLFDGTDKRNGFVYIIKKSDLPKLSTKEILEDIVRKYSLEKISEKYELLSSVIDMNATTDEVFNTDRGDKSDAELRKSVLLNIYITLEIMWKKNAKVIQLVEYSEFRQNGLLNSLSDVTPFEIKEGK